MSRSPRRPSRRPIRPGTVCPGPTIFSDGIPFEEDEDVLFPYWENAHDHLFLDEAVLHQYVCIYERQEHDLWNYLGPE